MRQKLLACVKAGDENISFYHQLYRQVNRDFPFSSALPRKIFPGFPGKIFWIYLSSFHVCRQCSPVQIKYVSFADRKKVVYIKFIFMFESIVIEVGFLGITTSKIEAVGYIMYYIFVIFL